MFPFSPTDNPSNCCRVSCNTWLNITTLQLRCKDRCVNFRFWRCDAQSSQSFKRGFRFHSSCIFCKTSANCTKTLGGLKYSRTVRITQASNNACSRNILLLSLFPFREDERLIFYILYLTDGTLRSKRTKKHQKANRQTDWPLTLIL